MQATRHMKSDRNLQNIFQKKAVYRGNGNAHELIYKHEQNKYKKRTTIYID